MISRRDFGKKTKGQVDYRIGSTQQKCGVCTMFREPHSCTAVQGNISKGMVCDLFEKKK